MTAQPEAVTSGSRVQDALKTVGLVWEALYSTSMNDSTEIARQIERAREDLIEALFAGPEGQELVRLDAAYKALTGEEPRSVVDVLMGRQPAHRDSVIGTDVLFRGPKEACRELMLHGPMRVWDYDQLESHFESEGITIDAENPRDAIRTAMAALVREGLAVKIGRGRFRPVRDVSGSTESEQEGGSLAGEADQGGADQSPSLIQDGGRSHTEWSSR